MNFVQECSIISHMIMAFRDYCCTYSMRNFQCGKVEVRFRQRCGIFNFPRVNVENSTLQC
jgi:hypothetical protein